MDSYTLCAVKLTANSTIGVRDGTRQKLCGQGVKCQETWWRNQKFPIFIAVKDLDGNAANDKALRFLTIRGLNPTFCVVGFVSVPTLPFETSNYS